MSAASPDFEEHAKAAVRNLGSKMAKRYEALRTAFQEQGDAIVLAEAHQLLEDTQNLSLGDSERLFGYLGGSRRVILPEPQPLLTEAARVPGLDGRKMSKSYGNAILLREEPDEVTRKIRTMQRPIRRACAAATRAIRRMPGMAAEPHLFERGDAAMGRQGMHDGRHRLPRLRGSR